MKDGDILNRAIKLSDYSVKEVLEKTGISHGTYYNLLKADIIDDINRELLDRLKLDLKFNSKNSLNAENSLNTPKQNQTTTTDMELTRAMIASMQRTIDLQQQMLDQCQDMIDSYKKRIAELEGKPLSKQGYK